MSNKMLQQAIIDAEALREVALKNAEAAVVEKYSKQIKEAVDNMLEQDDEEEIMPGPTPDEVLPSMADDIPLAATNGETLCPCPEEDDVIEIDFGDLQNLLKVTNKGEEAEEDDVETAVAIGEGEEAPLRESEEVEATAETVTEEVEATAETVTEEVVDEEIDLSALFEENVEENVFKDFFKSRKKPAWSFDQSPPKSPDQSDDPKERFILPFNSWAYKEFLRQIELHKTNPPEANWLRCGLEDHPCLAKEYELWAAHEDREKEYEEYEAEQKQKPISERKVLTKQKSKVLKENKELKQKQEKILKENKSLKENQEKLSEQNKNFRTLLEKLSHTLESVNLSNAKLVYTNQILGSTSLNERQRNKIVEAINDADSVETAKAIFETLQSTVGSSAKDKPQSLSEVVSSNHTPMLRRTEKKSSKDPHIDRMKKLAGI